MVILSTNHINLQMQKNIQQLGVKTEILSHFFRDHSIIIFYILFNIS